MFTAIVTDGHKDVGVGLIAAGCRTGVCEIDCVVAGNANGRIHSAVAGQAVRDRTHCPGGAGISRYGDALLSTALGIRHIDGAVRRNLNVPVNHLAAGWAADTRGTQIDGNGFPEIQSAVVTA